jgi:hypothetical protein
MDDNATDYKGYKITIDQDNFDSESPLDWVTPAERGAWYVMSHRQYNVPNELDVDFGDYDSWHELAEAEAKGRPYKYVRWYEHTGIAVSLRDDASVNDFDAGIVGVIIGETTQAIEASFAEWKCYIEGEIYRYDITDEFGNDVDSLGLIYGYDEALTMAKEAVDDHINRPYELMPTAGQMQAIAEQIAEDE